MEREFVSGSIAIAEGALDAGCRFFAGYPITPASQVLEYMAREMPKVGGTFIQAEDEIAAINMVIGASWAGVKAMTATSGPGFSLMQEGLGLAIITETPVVIVNAMRIGPSTGIPTKAGQGDVMQARWGSHGHYEIVVYAPYSIQEAYDYIIKSFNIAEALRTPVILLSDALLMNLHELLIRKRREIKIISRKKPTCKPEEYKPYRADEDLVPPMATFGEGFRVFVESLIHDENGYYDEKSYKTLVTRLSQKIIKNKNIIVDYELKIKPESRILLVAYGSLARSVKEFVLEKWCKGEFTYGLLRPISLWPSFIHDIKQQLQSIEKVIVFEMNLGQYSLEVERALRGKEVYFVPWLHIDIPSPEEVDELIIETLKR